MNVPLSMPDIGEREIEYVTRVLRSNQLSMGSWLGRFEEKFAEYAGTRYAIAANSGTSALHMCIRALGIGPGDEVITTSFSFVASVNCLLYEGVFPALVDIDPRTLNLDPEQVRDFLRVRCSRAANGSLIDRVTGNVVKAILPVHVFGLPCDMNAITAIANEYGLQVIEDACEAIGAEICGRRVGTFGNAAVFAFYPNKQMTTGEGGMIVTDDPHVAEVCRSLRNQGRDADGRWLRHVRLGYNYRLSDIHAALGLAQLERIEELLAARAAVARRYSELLPRHEVLQLPSEKAGMKRSWFVYAVRFRGDSRSGLRDRIRTHLQQNGIGAQAYFPSIHRQPYFEEYHKGPIPALPNTEDAASSSLAIPFSSRMSEPEIQYVCQEIMRGLDAEGEAPIPGRLHDSLPSSVSPRFP